LLTDRKKGTSIKTKYSLFKPIFLFVNTNLLFSNAFRHKSSLVKSAIFAYVTLSHMLQTALEVSLSSSRHPRSRRTDWL